MMDLPFLITYLLMRVLPQRLTLAISTAIAAAAAWFLFGWYRAEGRKIDVCNSFSGAIGRMFGQGSQFGCEAAPILQVAAICLCVIACLYFLFHAIALVYGLVNPNFDFIEFFDD
jgi:hypothetical protein